jgi:hypothetical protein
VQFSGLHIKKTQDSWLNFWGMRKKNSGIPPETLSVGTAKTETPEYHHAPENGRLSVRYPCAGTLWAFIFHHVQISGAWHFFEYEQRP